MQIISKNSSKNKRRRNKNKNGFIFTEIQEQSISQINHNFQNKNSHGFDGIFSKLLKLIEPEIIKPLTLLINQMLNTGQFPDKLKVAKVIPIFKNDPTLFTNYRPISLLSVISKVLERIMNNQLLMYFTNTKLLLIINMASDPTIQLNMPL